MHYTLNPLVHKFKSKVDETLQLPNYPKILPVPIASENIDKLKGWLLNQFATTIFNKCGKFPAMSGHPTHKKV